MKHLFLALCTRGWGETVLGIRMAEELRNLGHQCFFLTHESAGPLFENLDFPVMKMGDHAVVSGFLPVALRLFFQQTRPDSVILSDYYTTDLALEKAGVSPDFLKEFKVPIGAIDTWNVKRCGSHMDAMLEAKREVPDWTDQLDYRLTPVPIAPLEAGPGGSAYCCLPSPPKEKTTKKVARHCRRTLGLAEDERMVLFLTAGWQHGTFISEHCNRIKAELPKLLGEYVRKLGPKVSLVHVGPEALAFDLGERYRWLPSCAPQRFDSLLRAADLLLGFNISASTIAKAMVFGTPCAVMVNRQKVHDAEHLRSLTGSAPSAEMKAWLATAAPVFPYYMWPVGFFEFLAPLMEENPYCETIPLMEVLHEEEALSQLQGLLFDNQIRQDQTERQFSYVAQLREMPTAATHIVRHVQ